MIVLSSCKSKESTEYLEFPKTNWDMTLDQVKTAYEVEEKDISNYMENSYLEIEGYKIFEEKSLKVKFHFGDIRGVSNKLIAVEVEYPEDANMKKVLKHMTKTYGDTASEVNFISYSSLLMNDRFNEFPSQETEHLKVWSTGKLVDIVPKDKLDQYKEMWTKYLRAIPYDNNWDRLLDEGSLVTVGWTDQNEIGIQANKNMLNNKLYFDAMHLKVYQYIQEEIGE